MFHRMTILTFLVANMLCLFSANVSLAADKLAGTKPNIILVMTDDQGFAPVGRHGHPWIQTPNLDKMYDESVHLTHFYVAPTCAPTRAALMSGRHPMRNGITHTILDRERLALDTVTLPQVLAKAGYVSGIFGKWHLGDEDAYQPRNRGFNEEFIHGAGGIGQKYSYTCADVPDNSYFNPVVCHNGTFVKTEGFCTDVFFSAALDWINKVREKKEPFFAYITTNAPHGPFLAPEKYKKRFLKAGFNEKTAGFYGMIENIDDNVGLLFKQLAAWKMLDNTLVIFLSDNGMTGGGSNSGQKKGGALGTSPDGKPMLFYNAKMKGMKNTPDEGGVRVPAFFCWKDHLPKNVNVDTVLAHIDLLPTLAQLAGAECPKKQVEGRSFLPLLTNPKAPWDDRFLVTHRGRWYNNPEEKRYGSLTREQSKMNGFSIRNERFRLVNGKELYDIKKDPSQETNVIAQHPEVVKEMLKFYEQWWTETLPLMVNEKSENAPDCPKPYHVAYEKQKSSKGIPAWKPTWKK